jgi:hypothetical protein
MPIYKRLAFAFGCYGVLALLAAFTLDGLFRTVVWIFLAGLALKTWIAYKAGW